MSQKVHFELRSGGAWITLASPETRNALTPEILVGLSDGLERAIADPAVRCIVITGQGPAFCAGADLKAARSAPSPVAFRDILARLWFAPKPVIAAVNGAAFGGGLGLVCAADIVFASESARFSFSEVRLGAVPTVVSVLAIPKLGAAKANRLFLTGTALDGRGAEAVGLVDRAVDDGSLVSAVNAQVVELAKGAPGALATTKALTRRWRPDELASALLDAEERTRATFAGAEAAEGIAAFREKRPPSWIPKD